MKAILENDRCYSCVNHRIGGAFNTDGVARDHIEIEEARKAFDFTIEKHKSYTQDGRELPKQFHLRRTDDDSVIPTRGLGDEFLPVQHTQVLDYIVNDIMPQVPEMSLETVGTLHGGGTGLIMAKFGDNFKISGDMSPHVSRLFFINPNGKTSLLMGFTNVRLFCQNQLHAATNSASHSAKMGHGFRVQHTKNAEMNVDKAIQSIYDEVGAVRHLQMREERLAQIEAKEEHLMHILNKFFPLSNFEAGSKGYTRMMNQRQAVLNQWNDGETAQTFEGNSGAKLLNSFTYNIYNPITIGKETDLAQINYAGTVGTRADKVALILREVETELKVVA